MDPLGRQIILELDGCPDSRLNVIDEVESAMVEAADAMGATIVGAHFHRFEPHGVSGVVVISESHLTIHTWPEYGYAAVDVFTCGEDVEPHAALSVLESRFEPRDVEHSEIERGRSARPDPPTSRRPDDGPETRTTAGPAGDAPPPDPSTER